MGCSNLFMLPLTYMKASFIKIVGILRLYLMDLELDLQLIKPGLYDVNILTIQLIWVHWFLFNPLIFRTKLLDEV